MPIDYRSTNGECEWCGGNPHYASCFIPKLGKPVKYALTEELAELRRVRKAAEELITAFETKVNNEFFSKLAALRAALEEKE